MPFKKIAKMVKRGNAPVPEEDYVVEKVDVADIVFSVLESRQSVRNYSKRKVEDKLILKLMEAAGEAPSTGNYQPWEFIIVQDPEIKKQLVEGCYNQEWMLTAPLFIVACTNNRLAGAIYGLRGLKLYGIQSVAAAIQNILIAAEALGLSTCWVGAFSETIVSRVLECPEHVRPCAIITVGYAVHKNKKIPRQSIEEFVHSGRYGSSLRDIRIMTEKKPTNVKFK